MAPKDTEGVEKAHEQEIAKENASLKRAREGSQEPTPSPNPVALAPTKKNRLATTSEEQPSHGVVKESSGSDAETGKVGEVRRKVQEMTWKEGEGTGEQVQEWEEIKDEEVKEAKENAEEGTQEKKVGTAEGGIKRKPLDRNDSSILEKADPIKKTRDTPEPTSETAKPTDVAGADSSATAAPSTTEPTATQAPPKKAPTTFGSFASSSSPFASASAGRGAGASPFASASGSTSNPSSSKPPSSGSAFGNYSSPFSAFAKKTPLVPTSATSGQQGEGVGKDGEFSKAGPSKSTFGDILKESKGDEGEVSDKVQMTEKDVYTGEEGEETLYQCRSKLYVMQADGGWKERGVGALRLNVRSSDSKGPRLVMRAEGVLRLILNVSLYVGMACLEDGKHVRATVFEDGEKKFITFRLGTAKAATELCANIQEHIPLESKKSPAADAPSPSLTGSGREKDESAV